MAEYAGKINRRKFLKTVAGTTAGVVALPYIIPSSALGKDGTVAPSNRINMGCIGLGGQGTWDMLGFAKYPDVQVVALCDVNAGSDYYDMLYQFPGSTTAGLAMAKNRLLEHPDVKNKDLNIGTYHDFRDLLACSDVDAVLVTTPDHWHGLVSIAAAEAGKDIYCEKPLVNTIREGRAVCDAVKRYGRVLQTGSHERSNDSVRYACELICNGRIGRLHTIRINMPNTDKHHKNMLATNQPQPVMPVPEGLDYNFWLGPAEFKAYTKFRSHFYWRFILDYGGGEMTDRGAHIIDLAQLINNSDDSGPIEISAKGQAPENGIFNAFFKYEFQCNYANGVKMLGSSDSPRGLKLEGTDGWIFIHIHGGRLEASNESLLKEVIGPDEIHVGRSPGHLRDFLDAVKTRRFGTMATAEIGHRTATICHLLNIAMLTGRPLKWDPVSEKITNDEVANKMLSRPMRSPWRI